MSPLRIWKFAIKVQVDLFKLDHPQVFHRNDPDASKRVGQWIKDELIELGPAFVKIGQFASTRSDLLNKDITAELKKLQDNLPPAPFDSIEDLLNAEYEGDYRTIFKEVQPNCIASASIGQVHRSTLRNIDGGSTKEVVIKVQKPNVAMQIRRDLDTLKLLCAFFQKAGFQWAGEFDNVLSQYELFLTGELDYKAEQDHMLKFYDAFHNTNVYVPYPYVKYSTSRVLVMEYVPSTKITDFLQSSTKADMVRRRELAKEVMDVFLCQVVNYGMIHCDPHPGNIGVHEDGRIVLYDFGNVTFLGDSFRSNIQQLIVAIYQKDVDEFLDLLLAMKVIEVKESIELIELKEFFMYFFEYLETVDFQSLRASMMENTLLRDSQVNFKVDPVFLSLFRVFSLLDGTCLALDPNFAYLTVLQPYTQDLFTDLSFIDARIRRDVQKIRSFPKMIRNADSNILQINRRMGQLSEGTTNMKYMLFLFAIADAVDHPMKSVFLIPLILMILRDRR